MEEVSRRQWDYILYRDGADFILSVVCGTVGIFEINIKLDSNESRHYIEEGESYLAALAQQVRNDPDEYYQRHIK